MTKSKGQMNVKAQRTKHENAKGQSSNFKSSSKSKLTKPNKTYTLLFAFGHLDFIWHLDFEI
jgi:hypothetical protein